MWIADRVWAVRSGGVESAGAVHEDVMVHGVNWGELR